MTIFYRDPQSGTLVSVPDEIPTTERERIVLQYDIDCYDGTTASHWQVVADAINEGYGTQETYHSVRGVKKRFGKKLRYHTLKQLANATLEDNIIPRDREVTVADRKALALRLLETNYVSIPAPSPNGLKRRICVVSDYHGTVHPFVAESLLKRETYDICVHAGDILDMGQLHKSRIEGKHLTQQEQIMTVDEEIQRMRAWFELLDEHTKAQHIVMMGNHDARLYSLFVKYLDPILRSESLLIKMFRTPLELLTEGLENFTIGNRAMDWHYTNGDVEWAANSQYLVQLGDALVSHMNFTGKVPGTAVNKFYEWVQSYRIPLRLSDIRLFLQAHTHSLMIDRNCQGGHVHLVETGCALEAAALGYSLVYDGNWTPSAVGYITFDQSLENESWVTDLHSIKLHEVGEWAQT